MSTAFPQILIGDPIRHERLSIFPLFTDPLPAVEYVLGAEALADGTVVVEEVSESGSVPNLSVTNTSSFLVFFLEGEQLIGAKQNRILNTSILVAANSKTTIPVSCVEQGRWQFKYRAVWVERHLSALDVAARPEGQRQRFDQNGRRSQIRSARSAHNPTAVSRLYISRRDLTRLLVASLAGPGDLWQHLAGFPNGRLQLS